MVKYGLLLIISIILLAESGSITAQNEDKKLPLVTEALGIKEHHVSSKYWVEKSAKQQVFMGKAEIKAFNQENTLNDPLLYNVSSIPETLTREELMEKLRSVSRVPKYDRMYADCTPLTSEIFEEYEHSLALENIADVNNVKRALVVRRTPLRTYPSLTPVFNACSENKDIDRFQESAVFPADYVAVLHTSRDGKWALIQSYNYIAWVQLKDIAIGSKNEVEAYKVEADFLVITGDKVETVYNPDVPAVSEVQLDMGVRLPLSLSKAQEIHGQNPYLSHVVKLPVRRDDGMLTFELALIPKVKDVHVGYLPFTEENIIVQAFKFLGERYGWGHRYNARDCTGFVSEVYKTFGILLPRNSGDQGRGPVGINNHFEKDTTFDFKKTVLSKAQVGDLIYIPGHVMMVLGHEGDETWVIHDVTGAGYLLANGEAQRAILNGVSITPTLKLHNSKGRPYLDRVSNIKSVRLP